MPVPESGAEHIKVNSYVLFFRLRYKFLIYMAGSCHTFLYLNEYKRYSAARI